MKRFKAFLKLLDKITRAFTSTERIVVLLLAGVFFASMVQFALPAISALFNSEKGMYTEGLVGQFKVLNPLFVDFNDVDRDVGSLIFSGLVMYNPDIENFVPDLANFERSKDDRTYTFTLKENTLWHDGEPVTAEDVYFTFHDVIQDPGFKNVPLRRTFKGVEIKKINDRSVSFTLNNPNSFFVSNASGGKNSFTGHSIKKYWLTSIM